jgi:hypothetical protein
VNCVSNASKLFRRTSALRLIGPAPQNWIPDRAGVDHNVVLVGDGQTGSALAFALHWAGINRITGTIAADCPDDVDASAVWKPLGDHGQMVRHMHLIRQHLAG